MKTRSMILGILLIHCVAGALVAKAGRTTVAIAGGYSGATTEVDVEDVESIEVTFDGLAVAVRIGLRPRWGLQVNQTWTDSDKRLPTGDELSFRALHVHAYRSWRPQFQFRPYLKFGAMVMELEADSETGSTIRSDELMPSIGTGFEWGSQRVGAFFDVGFAPVDVELSGDVEDGLFIGNTTVGLFYRFGQSMAP